MSTIEKANENDFQFLSDIGKRAFIESHDSSASSSDINQYVAEKYNLHACEVELSDQKNNYHFIFQDEKPAGYSKLIFNAIIQTSIRKTYANWKEFICYRNSMV